MKSGESDLEIEMVFECGFHLLERGAICNVLINSPSHYAMTVPWLEFISLWDNASVALIAGMASMLTFRDPPLYRRRRYP